MNPAPQKVTSRYVSNLIKSGRNSNYVLHLIVFDSHIIDEVVIGSFFRARIETNEPNATPKDGLGITPAQAVRRALEKHGVTFR